MATALREIERRKWHDLYPELGTGPIPSSLTSRANISKKSRH